MNEGQIPSVEAIRTGSVLNSRYELLRRIATGGTGTVFAARDLKQEFGDVAVKVLHPSYQNNESIVARFIREGTLLNAVVDTHIVRTLEVHVEPTLSYLVTEFIVGKTLGEWFEECPEPYESLPGVITQICGGLKVVHELGILHRDLKPENILMQKDGIIKIIDFGAARAPKSNLTLAGQLIGTKPYIAPEVWVEKKLTPAVDFYSLGVILYQITTKQLPFETLRTSDLMRLHVESAPTPPNKIEPNIPLWLNHLILKLLVKNPTGRYQSSEQVLSYLAKAAQDDFDPRKRTRFQSISPAVSSSSQRVAKPRAAKEKPSVFAKLLHRNQKTKK